MTAVNLCVYACVLKYMHVFIVSNIFIIICVFDVQNFFTKSVHENCNMFACTLPTGIVCFTASADLLHHISVHVCDCDQGLTSLMSRVMFKLC